jgi:hypothetical protein
VLRRFRNRSKNSRTDSLTMMTIFRSATKIILHYYENSFFVDLRVILQASFSILNMEKEETVIVITNGSCNESYWALYYLLRAWCGHNFTMFPKNGFHGSMAIAKLTVMLLTNLDRIEQTLLRSNHCASRKKYEKQICCGGLVKL